MVNSVGLFVLKFTNYTNYTLSGILGLQNEVVGIES